MQPFDLKRLRKIEISCHFKVMNRSLKEKKEMPSPELKRSEAVDERGAKDVEDAEGGRRQTTPMQSKLFFLSLRHHLAHLNDETIQREMQRRYRAQSSPRLSAESIWLLIHPFTQVMLSFTCLSLSNQHMQTAEALCKYACCSTQHAAAAPPHVLSHI